MDVHILAGGPQIKTDLNLHQTSQNVSQLNNEKVIRDRKRSQTVSSTRTASKAALSHTIFVTDATVFQAHESKQEVELIYRVCLLLKLWTILRLFQSQNPQYHHTHTETKKEIKPTNEENQSQMDALNCEVTEKRLWNKVWGALKRLLQQNSFSESYYQDIVLEDRISANEADTKTINVKL